jgi:hypothetical protein
MTQPARINLPKEAILGKITEYQNSLLGIKIAELLPKQVRAGETVILTIKGENLAQCPQVKVVDPKTKLEIKDVEIALLPCSDNSKQMQFAVQAGAAAAGKKVWLIVISGPGQVVSKDSAPVYPTVELEIIPGGAGACASIAGKTFLIETNQNLQCSVIPAEITIGQETIISVSRMDDRPFTLPVIDPPTDIEVKNMKIEGNTVVLTLLAKDGATTGDRNIGIYDSLATADSITFDYGAFQVTVKAKPVEVKPKEAKPKEVKPKEVKLKEVKPAEEKPAGKDDGGDFDL